jgi:hypothetical protein
MFFPDPGVKKAPHPGYVISVADPDPLVRGMDPDPAPDPALDPDPSVIKQI